METNGPGGVPDLGILKTKVAVDERAEEAQLGWEAHVGLRCGGCKQRFTQGYEFLKPQVEPDPSRHGGIVKTQRAYACSDRDCGFAAVLAQDATAMRQIQQRFLDEGPEAEILGRTPRGD